jgi:hypothetical protein
MNRIIPVLFVLGSIWAMILWIPVLALFADDHLNQYPSFSLAALVGFWIWLGWGWHCLTGQFPLVSPRTFWTISLATHLVWLAILWNDPVIEPLSLSFLWIVTNIIVAFVELLPESAGKGWKYRLIGIATYGMPIAIATVVVGASVVANQKNLNGLNAFVLIVAVAALVLTAWRKPHQSRERHTAAARS